MEPSASAIIWRFNGEPPLFSGTLFPKCHCGTAQYLLFGSLSKFLRVDPERGYVQAELATEGTSSRTWKSRMRTSFRGLLAHSAQILPSMSSVIPTTIPSGLMVGVREAAESPIFEQIQSVIHSHPQIPGVVFEHSGDLITREDHWPAEWMRRSVPNVIERPSVCDPDRAISAGQNARC